MYSSFGYALFVELIDISSSVDKDFNKSAFTREIIVIIDGEDSKYLADEDVRNLKNMRCETKKKFGSILKEDDSELKEFLLQTLQNDIDINRFKCLVSIAIEITNFNQTQKKKLLSYSEEPIELFTAKVLEEVLRTGENSPKKRLKRYKETVNDILAQEVQKQEHPQNFGHKENDNEQESSEPVNEDEKNEQHEEINQEQSKASKIESFFEKRFNRGINWDKVHFLIPIVSLIIALIFLRITYNLSSKMSSVETLSKLKTSGTKQVEEVKADWGPSRKTFSSLALPENVVFNSIENANLEGYFSGDERYFCSIRKVDAKEWKNEVVLEVGSEYEVISFFHNNSKSSVANDVTMKNTIPTAMKKDESKRIYSFIGSSNSEPKEIWDSVIIKANENVAMRLEKNSVQIKTDGKANNSIVNDEFFSNGAKIGFDGLNGTIPSSKYGQVRYKFKVFQPNFEVSMKVSKHDENDWQPTLNANYGDIVDFLVEFKNSGQTDMRNVIMRIDLPKELNYALDSSSMANGSSEFKPVDISDGMTTGYNIGHYTPDSNAFIKFSAKLLNRDKEKGDLIEVKAYASTPNGQKNAVLKIAVDK
ncbi:hypothetical protein KQI58_16335 [Enterococcus raffinosus]|uniref:hypothetical protein n=1 Tax=Enterococcus raffinosus TaxID=71452 RepID=UPI001C0F9A65|nr:hypothetical protein [Enterococcus raffinosus]MBU5362642.1 hypothetical protein [Enterococcus raffinosus]